MSSRLGQSPITAIKATVMSVKYSERIKEAHLGAQMRQLLLRLKMQTQHSKGLVVQVLELDLAHGKKLHL